MIQKETTDAACMYARSNRFRKDAIISTSFKTIFSRKTFQDGVLTALVWFFLVLLGLAVESMGKEINSQTSESNFGQGSQQQSERICTEAGVCASSANMAAGMGIDESKLLRILEAWSAKDQFLGRPILLIRPQFGLGNRLDLIFVFSSTLLCENSALGSSSNLPADAQHFGALLSSLQRLCIYLAFAMKASVLLAETVASTE
jgi:hypothetical protein